ncbi:junctional cadherin 5-associated protein [Dipodomys merriami]|uniref:junctional cadherin 5-associated protein n=1 Tax=Dipodomys merriami TaxID=94247 RepID=UPI0038559A95
MYSVEDLLISHGYKPSRDLPRPREDNPRGHRQARSRTRAEHDLLNGYGDDPAAFAYSQTSQGKRPVSDSESRRSTPGSRGEHHSTSVSRTSEAGLYNRPTLAWSSKPQVGSDHTHRRRGQEVSNLPGSRDREAQEVRRMARVHGLPSHMREGSWEVGGRTEQVMKKAVWEEELRMLGPAKWPSASPESWNESRKLGRHMSDGDGEKLFQDLYPFVQEEHGLTSQNKRKSRSLPRVLSPESLACTEIPLSIKDSYLPGVPRIPPHPSNCAPHLESTRNPEKGATPAPFPRPKFGRPVKPPPSYSSYQPSRAGENSSFQESDANSYLTKSNDPRHDLGVSDAGLEPPVYVPPPSYKSPPQHIPNPYLEDTEPIHVSDSQGQQEQHGAEKDGTNCPLPPGPGGAGNTYGVAPVLPQGLPSHAYPVATYDGCVQYIPFDDPRIRHIKLAPPAGLCEETKFRDRQYDSGPVTAREPARGQSQHNGILLHPQDLTPSSDAELGPASAHPNPQWLWGLLPRNGENGGFTDPRDPSVVSGPWSGRCPESQASSPHSQSEDTCRSQTKLRKFETGIQTKKSSKKKTNETIFCLVSIPVKSEAHLPDIDTNNNDLKSHAEGKPGLDKNADLQEQSLLSMSSTDLELQALTGSMAGRFVFLKQDLEELEDKQTNDLKFVYLTKHRELKYSGSWPGHQYRDQQTQTSFPEEAKGPRYLPATEPGEPRSPDPTLPLDLPASEASLHMALTSTDQTQKPNAPDLRGQVSLSPSSNSAFSRTSSSKNVASMPKADASQPCVDVHGQDPEAKPTAKPEVVKGEPTAARCNSEQLFGQFLLKPVSRRPWDLISQLESFNKELQEEEKSESEGSGDNSSQCSEADLQHGAWANSRPGAQGLHNSHPEMSPEQQPRPLPAPEDSETQVGSVKRTSESWSIEPRPSGNCPGFSSPTQAEGSRGDPFQWGDAGARMEQPMQAAVNGLSKLAVGPGPVQRWVTSRPSDTKPAGSAYWAEQKEPSEGLTKDFGAGPLSRGVLLKGESSRERDTVVPLSIAHKTRGLSAPDLRSTGLNPEQEQNTTELNGALGGEGAVEIPPGESLQARAERILGIEVAVESLLPGTRAAGQSQPPKPDASPCSPDLSTGKSVPRSAPSGGPTLATDAFYGRRKCGWTESPLFVGERAPQASACSGVDRATVGHTTGPEPQPSSLESKTFEEKDLEVRPPFRSTLFHFVERTPNGTGSEKRLRSPSKVIESLQEKLASPPRRVDPDRLMRMKEVSSVSRMRSLSFHNADSTEEAEDPKASRGHDWQPGDLVSGSSEDPAWRLGYPHSVSKGFIPPEENGHPSTQRRERIVDPDFWCPESYDPSRVERV